MKFENCFHTGGGEGGVGLATLVVVVVGFCGVAILTRIEIFDANLAELYLCCGGSGIYS